MATRNRKPPMVESQFEAVLDGVHRMLRAALPPAAKAIQLHVGEGASINLGVSLQPKGEEFEIRVSCSSRLPGGMHTHKAQIVDGQLKLL